MFHRIIFNNRKQSLMWYEAGVELLWGVWSLFWWKKCVLVWKTKNLNVVIIYNKICHFKHFVQFCGIKHIHNHHYFQSFFITPKQSSTIMRQNTIPQPHGIASLLSVSMNPATLDDFYLSVTSYRICPWVWLLSCSRMSSRSICAVHMSEFHSMTE